MVHASEEGFLWLHPLCQPEGFLCVQSLSTPIPSPAVPEHHPHPLDGRRLETHGETGGKGKCWPAGRIRDNQKYTVKSVISKPLFSGRSSDTRRHRFIFFCEKVRRLGRHPESHEWDGDPILKQQNQAGNCCSRGISFKTARQHLCYLDQTFLITDNLHWVKSSCMLKDSLRAGKWIPQAHVLASTVHLCSSPAAALSNSTRALCNPAALGTVTVVRRKLRQIN